MRKPESGHTAAAVQEGDQRAGKQRAERANRMSTPRGKRSAHLVKFGTALLEGVT
jgi:hypothetical protein